MGACDSNYTKCGRENEVKIPGSKMHEINPCLYDVCRSICKIKCSKHLGTGFFIRLYKIDKPFFH